MTAENFTDELKKKLFQLHFLLTEKESEETIRQSIKQFEICFNEALSQLSVFLDNEHAVQPTGNLNVIELALEHKLVNSTMANQLKSMVIDFEATTGSRTEMSLYNNIKAQYSGYLQTIYDMLSRMGQDADEE